MSLLAFLLGAGVSQVTQGGGGSGGGGGGGPWYEDNVLAPQEWLGLKDPLPVRVEQLNAWAEQNGTTTSPYWSVQVGEVPDGSVLESYVEVGDTYPPDEDPLRSGSSVSIQDLYSGGTLQAFDMVKILPVETLPKGAFIAFSPRL